VSNQKYRNTQWYLTLNNEDDSGVSKNEGLKTIRVLKDLNYKQMEIIK